MSIMSKNTALVGALALASKVAAHGIVTGIVADGQYNLGYDPAFQYARPPPTVAGWSIPTVQDRGFVQDLNGPDIVCHRGATPGGTYVKVAAGGTLEFQWTEWPESHHGPMIDYLAPCGDDCTTVEKTSLKFIKVAEAGLVNGSPAPGKWASDDMIANNNTWTVKVPQDVAPGKYVWRHETIALHAAHENQGAQAYPQCVNVEITGSGSNEMGGGIPATEFYSWSDKGMFLNIYYPALTSYDIPGPPLMEGGGSTGPKPPTNPPFPAGNSSTLPVSESSTTTSNSPPTGRPTGRPYSTYESSTTDTSVKPIQTSTSQQQPQPTGGASNPPSQGPPSQGPPSQGPPSQGNPSPSPPSQDNAPAPPPLPQGNGPQPPKPDTPPVSFTSTLTGRIGKPTKFTCYLEED